MISLGDVDECKKALNVLGIDEDQWKMEEGKMETGYPKGCYQYISSKDMFQEHVYFNSNPNGSKHKDAKPICRNG